MSAGKIIEPNVPTSAAAFVTTHWSVVLAAGEQPSPQSHEALNKLCQTYWYPVYSYVRRSGQSPHDAQEATQGFFVHLLEKELFARADRQRGRFRSFLLGALKNFLKDERAKANASKRGGGKPVVSLDELAAEERYRHEPATTLDPETIFERRWAITLLDRVLSRLEAEFTANGKSHVFERLSVYLLEKTAPVSYAEAGAVLNMNEGAVKTAVCRLREDYRRIFYEEIAHTVADAREIDDEVRHLFAVIQA